MPTSRDETKFRQLTLRLPASIHQHAKRLAKARHVSVNTLILNLLEKLERAEREKELEKAYEFIGQEASEVEFAFKAQSEVVRRG